MSIKNSSPRVMHVALIGIFTLVNWLPPCLAQLNPVYENFSAYQLAISHEITAQRKGQLKTLGLSLMGLSASGILHALGNSSYEAYQTGTDKVEILDSWDRTQSYDGGAKTALGLTGITLIPLLQKEFKIKRLKASRQHIPGKLEQVYSDSSECTLLLANEINGTRSVLVKLKEPSRSSGTTVLKLLEFDEAWQPLAQTRLDLPDMKQLLYMDKKMERIFITGQRSNGPVQAPIIYCFSTSGELIWERQLGDGFEQLFYQRIENNIRMFHSSGDQGGLDRTVLEMDGSIRDQLGIETDSLGELRQVMESPDGLFLSSIATNIVSETHQSLVLAKLDMQMQLLWKVPIVSVEGILKPKLITQVDQGSVLIWYSVILPLGDYYESVCCIDAQGHKLYDNRIPGAAAISPVQLSWQDNGIMVLGNQTGKVFFRRHDEVFGELVLPDDRQVGFKAFGLFSDPSGGYDLLMAKPESNGSSSLHLFRMSSFH